MLEPVYKRSLNAHALQVLLNRDLDIPKPSLAVGETEILEPFVYRIAPVQIHRNEPNIPPLTRIEQLQDVGNGPQIDPENIPREYWLGTALGDF